MAISTRATKPKDGQRVVIVICDSLRRDLITPENAPSCARLTAVLSPEHEAGGVQQGADGLAVADLAVAHHAERLRERHPHRR